jgi:hypothetical protein
MVEMERDEGVLPSLVDVLFTATQRRVLAVLFGHPGREIHLRGLLRYTGAGHGAVQRAVRGLVAKGLVKSRRERNRRYLQADPSSPIHPELTALVRKSVGLAEPLRADFALAEKYLPGCFAFEDEAGLGLVAVLPDHPVPLQALDFARAQAELTLRRSVRVFDADREQLRTDPYLAEVLGLPRVWVFGGEASVQDHRFRLAGHEIP